MSVARLSGKEGNFRFLRSHHHKFIGKFRFTVTGVTRGCLPCSRSQRLLNVSLRWFFSLCGGKRIFLQHVDSLLNVELDKCPIKNITVRWIFKYNLNLKGSSNSHPVSPFHHIPPVAVSCEKSFCFGASISTAAMASLIMPL